MKKRGLLERNLVWIETKKHNTIDIHHDRAIAGVIDDIGRFVLKESIPMCLPFSKPDVIYYP